MRRCLFPLLTILPLAASAGEAAPSYNQDIRPILSENCLYCHGQDPNHRKAGLRLDVREVATKEMESGATAIVPGRPDQSELVARIRSEDDDEQMPPPKSHRVLTASDKETLKRWIAAGAKYEEHWAFTAPVRPALPEVRQADWPRNEIDRFVLARLEAEGMAPSPEADPTTLLRRVTLDLTGLPPTPDEVEAFLSDPSPEAYERVVDRLLASPHYGERMALPWLDAARYADSNGFQQDGDTWQWIWRDWVVGALNADLPFDRFSIEQLAGDLLPNATTEQKIASGFNRNHMLNGEGGAIPEEQRFNILFDRVDTTATTWLGLTVACAQCHDHKYDPITQHDYYSLLSAFNNLPENGLVPGNGRRTRIAPPFLALPTPEQQKRLEEMKAQQVGLDEAAKLKDRHEPAWVEWRSKLSPQEPKWPAELAPALQVETSRDEAHEAELVKKLRDFFERNAWAEILKKSPEAKKAEELKKERQRLEDDEIPRVMVMEDSKPRPTNLLDRGRYENPKERVEFATPAFLPPRAAGTPANRLGLAEWLFQPDQPLTARVQVNRMWQLFFGVGLVKTSEDFGRQSSYPVYRDLLDWLAVEFRERGWSMKKMHRLIVTSATYRQSSRVTPEMLRRDPENHWLGRAARFRLPSTILRDVALAASGLLDGRLGGKPVYPYQPDGIWETLAITKERDFTYPQSHGADLYRRSLYTFWRRTVGPADMFDGSVRRTCRVRTAVTCTPLHALTTLNDPIWVEASRTLAQHALQAAPETDARLTYLFRRILGRRPRDPELALLRHTLERQQAIYRKDTPAATALLTVGQSPRDLQLDPAEHASMTAVCLALFNLDQALSHE